MNLTGNKKSHWNQSGKSIEICSHSCPNVEKTEDKINLSARQPNTVVDFPNFQDQTSECKNIDIEGVAEIIGEVSDSLNGFSSSVCLDFFSKIEQCLQNCLNPLEKLSWINMSIDLYRNFDKKWTCAKLSNYENDYEENSICQLIEIARSLITHLNRHLTAANVAPSKHLQIQPVPENSVYNKHHIMFTSRYFTLALLKNDCQNNCHNCDVALILLYIFSRCIKTLDTNNNLRDSNIYSSAKNNYIGDIINNNSILPKVDLKDFTPVQQSSSHSDTAPQNVQIRANTSTILPGCVSFEDVGWLHSEFLPVKGKQTSSDIQIGECETMPPDMCHGLEEEKRMSKVTYGSMERVLQFIKNYNTNHRSLTNWNQAVGIVLQKYKRIIKIKNESYDEGVHFIKGTDTPLGSGCFGKCFLATDMDTRSYFCLKMVKSFNSSEIEIWAMLNDIKGIPKFYGILFYTDYVYILQEFIHGPTLKSIICQSKSQMNLISSLGILKNLLLILSKLHQKDIIHNDVKADNIILENCQVFLVDFGLSVKLMNGVNQGIPCGSQCHWSPEKAASEEYGVKSDVWAAMVVFVHMISGTEPWLKRFDGCKALHFIIKTRSPPADDIPTDIPDAVRDLIMRGWEIDAHIRAEASELLDHEAFQLIETLGQQEKQNESIELVNRSMELKNEDIIMQEAYFQSQQLLSEVPDKFKYLDSNPDITSSHDSESLIDEAMDVLAGLSNLPPHMINLSVGILEEIHQFFKDEDAEETPCDIQTLDCINLENYLSSTDFKLIKDHSRIPLTVEEQSLSSDESEEDLYEEASVVVLLEDGTKVYSCNLNLYSITRWSDVAERCSTAVHNRNINSFYLILYPSGEKINASENVMDTKRKKHMGVTTQFLSGSNFNINARLPNDQQHNSNNIIQAEVVEIENDVQKWEWKVENCRFMQLLK